jgi:hypothetical protein
MTHRAFGAKRRLALRYVDADGAFGPLVGESVRLRRLDAPYFYLYPGSLV